MTSGSNIPPVTPAPAKPAGQSGQVLPVVTLPDAWKNNARAVRLEGEVVAQNKDGSTRIRTSEGDMDVTFRGKQPQVGTKLEVDVPTGNPPRNVTVRPAPPPASQPVPLPQTPIPTTPTAQTPVPAAPSPLPAQDGTKPAPQQPTTQQPIPQQPPPLPPTSQTPAPAPAPATPAPPTNALPQLPPLTVGDVVEMVPLPQAPQMPATNNPPLPAAPLKQYPLQMPVQNTGLRIENAIVQKPQSGIVTGLLQAMKSMLPQLNAPQILPAPSNQPAPVIPQQPISTNVFGTAVPDAEIILPQPSPIFAKIMAITSPTGQTMYAAPEIVQPNIVAPAIQNTATMATQAQPITVTVSSFTPQNQPVVPLPINMNGVIQNFVIQAPPATLPAGTQVTLLPVLPPHTATPSVSAPSAAPSIVPAAWRGFLPLMQASSSWPVMDEIFQTFYHATPQAAQILGRVIPSPANAQNLGPAIMLFVAAARAGELQNWVGDKKMDMIQKLGKTDLVSRLSAETSSLSGNNDLPATEWKSLPIPMLWQNEISKVLFHVRREPDENGKPGKDGKTRFLLDLSLPRMGEVQLDGMIHGKRLDLIVRTQMPVSYPMQEAMKAAYAGALEGSDVFGELGFQGDLKQWMHVVKGSETFAANI